MLVVFSDYYIDPIQRVCFPGINIKLDSYIGDKDYPFQMAATLAFCRHPLYYNTKLLL